jgi:hypothetical protein
VTADKNKNREKDRDMLQKLQQWSGLALRAVPVGL